MINFMSLFSIADSIRKMDDQEVPEIVCPSAGVHIILPNYYSPEKMGLIDPETSDGRVIFLLPWQNSTIAGTTDSPCEVVYKLNDPRIRLVTINQNLFDISNHEKITVFVR